MEVSKFISPERIRADFMHADGSRLEKYTAGRIDCVPASKNKNQTDKMERLEGQVR